MLVSGGNAYSIPYVTDIVDFSLDNSGYSISSASVPFAGMVLHGYVNYAGTPMNMEGDVQYKLLKSLENGAALYFTLSYENTDLLKDSIDLSSYYAVNFDLWLPKVISFYKTLNDAIGSLQDATITSHEFEKAFRMDESSSAIMFGTYNKLLLIASRQEQSMKLLLQRLTDSLPTRKTRQVQPLLKQQSLRHTTRQNGS